MKLAIVFIFALTFTLSSCSSGEKEITAAEFKNFATQTIGTMSYYEYIGVVDGKAILIHHQMSGIDKSWSKTNVWVSAAK
jgi:hypothetical protein